MSRICIDQNCSLCLTVKNRFRLKTKTVDTGLQHLPWQKKQRILLCICMEFQKCINTYCTFFLSFRDISHHSRLECRRNKEMNKRFRIFGSADMYLQPRTNRDWLQSSAVLFSIDCSLSSSSFKCWGVLLFIRKVVLFAKAITMNHDYLTPMRLTVNVNTVSLTYLILRESWYKPVPAMATLTLNRFQFFCNMIWHYQGTGWARKSVFFSRTQINRVRKINIIKMKVHIALKHNTC
jgi:hypothetical protein